MSQELNPEFADNPEPRCACVLLLDTSSSMTGEPIAALNEGLRAFQDAIAKDALASLRVEVAVVEFNSAVTVVQDFVSAGDFSAPTLTANGATHMASAIEKALQMVQQRKETYKQAGVAYYRPWILMITDGEPAGESDSFITDVTGRLKADEDHKRVAFFGVAVEGANMAKLQGICPPNRPPIRLKGLAFKELFVWLSGSMGRVSRSKTADEQIPLPPPSGWASV